MLYIRSVLNRIRCLFGCLVTILALLGATGCAGPAGRSPADLTPLLRNASPSFAPLLAQGDELRLQILISEVITNRLQRASLRRWAYRVDAEYFYPASAVKLCAAVAALRKIEQLAGDSGGVDLLQAPWEIAPLFPGDIPQREDPSNLEGHHITVGQEIRKLALVSDNQAFNRLFDLVGHEYLNQSMFDLGLTSVVLNHRLSEPRRLPNPLASAASFFLLTNSPPLRLADQVSSVRLTNQSARLRVGVGYLRGDRRIDEPMDFSQRNGIALSDLQRLLVKVVRPDIDLGTPPLELTPGHRAFLIQAMGEFPRESANPKYPGTQYPDEYGKFLLPGIRRQFPAERPGERIEVVGKIGQAYGFSVENAYLRNPANGKAVFVTAVLYTNRDGILNDDRYEYDTVAAPFYMDLGEFVARRWLK